MDFCNCCVIVSMTLVNAWNAYLEWCYWKQPRNIAECLQFIGIDIPLCLLDSNCMYRFFICNACGYTCTMWYARDVHGIPSTTGSKQAESKKPKFQIWRSADVLRAVARWCREQDVSANLNVSKLSNQLTLAQTEKLNLWILINRTIHKMPYIFYLKRPLRHRHCQLPCSPSSKQKAKTLVKWAQETWDFWQCKYDVFLGRHLSTIWFPWVPWGTHVAISIGLSQVFWINPSAAPKYARMAVMWIFQMWGKYSTCNMRASSMIHDGWGWRLKTTVVYLFFLVLFLPVWPRPWIRMRSKGRSWCEPRWPYKYKSL